MDRPWLKEWGARPLKQVDSTKVLEGVENCGKEIGKLGDGKDVRCFD